MTDRQFIGRTLILLLLLGLALLLWVLADVLLLAFGAVLIAVALTGLGEAIERRTSMPRALALALIVVLALAAAGAGGWFFGTQLADQFGELAQTIPQSFERARQMLQGRDWGRHLLDELQEVDLGGLGGRAVPRLFGTITTVLGALTNAFLIVVAGLYLAFQSGLYRRGLLRLVPPGERDDIGRFLQEAGRALRLWLLGQLVAMAAVGLLSALALWLIGVPLAVALGVIAGLTEFIPILGPILGAVPAVLVALASDPTLALYTVAAFALIQQLENHLLAPLIQQEAVSLPPALTIFATIGFGIALGTLGLLFATPLAVLAMVAVDHFYRRRVLGE